MIFEAKILIIRRINENERRKKCQTVTLGLRE